MYLCDVIESEWRISSKFKVVCATGSDSILERVNSYRGILGSKFLEATFCSGSGRTLATVSQASWCRCLSAMNVSASCPSFMRCRQSDCANCAPFSIEPSLIYLYNILTIIDMYLEIAITDHYQAGGCFSYAKINSQLIIANFCSVYVVSCAKILCGYKEKLPIVMWIILV